MFQKDRSDALPITSPRQTNEKRIIISKTVLELIQNSQPSITKNEIERKLLEMGVKSFHPIYLYSLLRQLVKKGLISKEGKCYVATS